jgi:hypothetical protein
MKVVQIVGGGYGNISFPLKDEVWLMNSVIRARYSFDFDDWTHDFDLHTKEWILDHRSDIYQWYRTQKKPIYLTEYDPEIIGCKIFDFDFYINFFKTTRFAHTLDWLMAKAIYEKFEQIEFYYCPLDNHDKTTLSYWIGQAEARGIKIIFDYTFGCQPPDKIYRK